MSSYPMTRCGDCRFWQEHRTQQDGTRRLGNCRRRAPTVNPNTLGGRIFPQTDANDGCGEGLR